MKILASILEPSPCAHEWALSATLDGVENHGNGDEQSPESGRRCKLQARWALGPVLNMGVCYGACECCFDPECAVSHLSTPWPISLIHARHTITLVRLFPWCAEEKKIEFSVTAS